ncbi:MAG: hypothetical protein AAGF85_00380 [Bacteroidota bacterium]
MKKLGFFLLVGMFALSACTDEAEETGIDGELTETALTDAEVDAVYEDVDDMVNLSLESTDNVLGGKVTEDEPDDDRFCDGIVSFEGDKTGGTITIDFGEEGCLDRNGNLRKGKIIIVYSGPRFLPGSTVITTLENYSINGIAIEGTRTLENISTSTIDYPTFHITLVGGKVTWPDETFATRDSDRVRVWKRERNPREDSHLVTGEANGITRRGVAYEMQILDTLVYKRACIPSRRARIPVQGVKQIETRQTIITIDFGDGECDRNFEVSVEGKTEDVTVD